MTHPPRACSGWRTGHRVGACRQPSFAQLPQLPGPSLRPPTLPPAPRRTTSRARWSGSWTTCTAPVRPSGDKGAQQAGAGVVALPARAQQPDLSGDVQRHGVQARGLPGVRAICKRGIGEGDGCLRRNCRLASALRFHARAKGQTFTRQGRPLLPRALLIAREPPSQLHLLDMIVGRVAAAALVPHDPTPWSPIASCAPNAD